MSEATEQFETKGKRRERLEDILVVDVDVHLHRVSRRDGAIL